MFNCFVCFALCLLSENLHTQYSVGPGPMFTVCLVLGHVVQQPHTHNHTHTRTHIHSRIATALRAQDRGQLEANAFL